MARMACSPSSSSSVSRSCTALADALPTVEWDMCMVPIESWCWCCGTLRGELDSAPEAAAATARARIESSASDVFRFLISPPVQLTRLIRGSADYGSTVLPTRDDVERARAAIGDRLPPTPLLGSRTIGARLKCELFQR